MEIVLILNKESLIRDDIKNMVPCLKNHLAAV